MAGKGRTWPAGEPQQPHQRLGRSTQHQHRASVPSVGLLLPSWPPATLLGAAFRPAVPWSSVHPACTHKPRNGPRFPKHCRVLPLPWTSMPEGSAGAGSGAMKPGAVIKKIFEVARELTEAGRARQNRRRGGMGRARASASRAPPVLARSPTSTPRRAESRPVRLAGPGWVATTAMPSGGTTGVSAGCVPRRARERLSRNFLK